MPKKAVKKKGDVIAMLTVQGIPGMKSSVREAVCMWLWRLAHEIEEKPQEFSRRFVARYHR